MLQRGELVKDYKMPCSVFSLQEGVTYKDVVFKNGCATFYSTDDWQEVGVKIQIVSRTMVLKEVKKKNTKDTK